MGFKKVENNPRSNVDSRFEDPTIGITASGGILVYSAAAEEYFADATSVNLHADVEKRQLGIEPVGDESGSHALTDRKYGYTISGKGVLKTLGLALPDEHVKFELEFNEEAGFPVATVDTLEERDGGDAE